MAACKPEGALLLVVLWAMASALPSYFGGSHNGIPDLPLSCWCVGAGYPAYPPVSEDCKPEELTVFYKFVSKGHPSLCLLEQITRFSTHSKGGNYTRV